MISKKALFYLIAITAYADAEFSSESLVLTDAPCHVELIANKAESNLQFCKDLGRATEIASRDSKFILLIVIGNNSCPWSEKLLFDVIYKPEFYLEAQKKFVLCKMEVDQISINNVDLGLDHSLEKVPLFVCLSKDGKVFAKKLNIPETASEVVRYLNDAVAATNKIGNILDSKQPMQDDILEEHYKIAKNLGLKFESDLYNLGLLKKKNIFFLLEKYQKLLTSGTLKELKDLKLDIQRLDPRNIKGAIRAMAIFDFEERIHQKKGMENPFSALKPLFEYIRDYGPYDKENRWAIEMKIARFLFAKNQLQAALQHASRSLEWAPEERKGEVSDTVELLKQQKEKPDKLN